VDDGRRRARPAIVTSPPAPPGATWVGPWQDGFDDRVFGGDPISAGGTAALLTGVQRRDGSTVTGVAVRVGGVAIPGGGDLAVTADLTPGQARELAAALRALADQADTLDGTLGDGDGHDDSPGR
jgi:hypothetical protein